ncbi:MAG: NUDIX hydrolase [Gemmatimonadota bacterium]|nr:MAG: NUDIX hydrolase [Gemmatimonadota bacterium]
MPQDLPTCVATRRAYDGKLVKVEVDTVRTPSGTEFDLEIVRHPGAAAIVPLLSQPDSPDPAVLLIEQYRYATGGAIWEVPAGVLEAGEDPADCARRELTEETGAVAGSVEHLTTIYTTPGFTDERIHVFLATDLTQREPSHEPDELIRVEPVPLARALEMIRDGEIADAKSVVALLYVAGYRLNL